MGIVQMMKLILGHLNFWSFKDFRNNPITCFEPYSNMNTTYGGAVGLSITGNGGTSSSLSYKHLDES